MPKYDNRSLSKVHHPIRLHVHKHILILDDLMDHPERQQFNKNLAATLSKSLRVMLAHTSSEKGRGAVPPITNSEVSPFPLKITVRVGGVELG